MDFAIIEAFVAVVEFGGFTRAAEALHLSQPALSRRIALLENELRRPVFERRGRSVHLTDAGSTFLPHAQAALASIRDGAAAVAALEGDGSGNVTLAIVGTLASTAMPQRLATFQNEHPHVRVLLRTGNSAEVSSLVRRGEAILGLRYFADPAADIVSIRVYAEPMIVVAGADHPLVALAALAAHGGIDAEQLRGQPWIAFPERRGANADSFGRILAGRLATNGLDGAEIVVIDSLTAQKRLAQAGFGLALVPESSVQEELASGALCRLEVPAMESAVDVALIHRDGAFFSTAARRLIEVLQQSGR